MKFTEKMYKNFWGFLVETFEFSEEQTLAIDKQVPMTQEMFDSIMKRCEELGPDVDNLFFRMVEDYPEFSDVYVARIEKEIEGVELPEMTEEEKQLSYEKLCERIRAKFGPDAI